MGRIVNLQTGKQKELYAQHSFGRDPVTSSTCICDSYVSRTHAVLTWDGMHWLLKDVSRNGTFLNGKRLEKDQNHSVRLGDKMSFGSESAAQWEIIDDGEPRTMLVPKDGGEEILLHEFHALPSHEDPKVFLYFSNGRWACETETHTHWLETGDIVGTKDQKWQFVEAIPLEETEEIESSMPLKPSQEMLFRFNASQDEEHVFLTVEANGQQYDLEERVHHYVMLELARKRLADKHAGLGESEQGWIERKEFASMVGLDDTNHLNMQVFRFRKQLHKTIPSSENLPTPVQSRRHEIRFFADNVEIMGGLPLV